MRARLGVIQQRLFPHGVIDVVRQVLLFALAYQAYSLVRGQVDDARGATVAFQHGRDLIYLERSLHLFVEPSIQAWAQTKPAIIDTASWVYLNAQTTVTVVALIFIYIAHNRQFYFVRNMMVTAMIIALIGYVVFPAAPPRFYPEWGFIDSVSTYLGVNHTDKVNDLFNPYAAVPSMHVAFSLMIGWTLARITRRKPVRVFWAVYPFLITFVIVSTANHFLADAFFGACTAAVAVFVATRLAQARPAAWSFSPPVAEVGAAA